MIFAKIANSVGRVRRDRHRRGVGDHCLDQPAVISVRCPADLYDAGGTAVTMWTVSDLRPSTDMIAYPVAGQLWEATGTAEAVRGNVAPVVAYFNAQADNSQTYRALFNVPTPEGINPMPLPQGSTSTGKMYFDVIGNAARQRRLQQDVLIWKD